MMPPEEDLRFSAKPAEDPGAEGCHARRL